MQFQTAYYTPMDRGYDATINKDKGISKDIEKPLLSVSEIGQSVTEGQRFGSLIQTATAAIRAGVGRIELQTGMGGGAEPVGAEAYGKDAREVLREIARANKVQLTSVHTPTEIGNMSGFNPQQGSFDDNYRKRELEEVKSAIKFAAEATEGGAVVVHTGEYQRPIFNADWNDKEEFISYDEEPERAVMPLVDDRTGRVLQEVRRNQEVFRPKWNRYSEENENLWEANNGESYTDPAGKRVDPGDYVDYEGNKIEKFENRVPVYDPEKGLFLTEKKVWDDFEKEADERNEQFEKENGRKPIGDEIITPEESFLQAQLESQIGVAKGWALNYGMRVKQELEELDKLKKSKEFYEKLEKNVPEEELWKLKKEVVSQLSHLGLASPEYKMPSKMIEDSLWNLRKQIESSKDMAVSQMQQAQEQELMKQHAVSISKYAKKKTMNSYAEAGIEAMQQSHHNPHAKRDVFVAPENIFPEMGYGSHPEELIELVKNARKQMVKHLTQEYIEDPSGKVDEKGNPHMIENPNYSGVSEEKAQKEAEDHIKATLDTQHMAMWLKHFKPEPGEREDQRKERFHKWYLEEVGKMADEKIIGNIHLVDAIGSTHQHLPAGQGELPLKQAINILKKKGYNGIINSEAWGEESRFGAGRIVTETWSAFGSPVYSFGAPAAGGTWNDVHQSYFGKSYPPNFIFGSYSPSNEWTLWSQVPME